jgi:hypothetical protein
MYVEYIKYINTKFEKLYTYATLHVKPSPIHAHDCMNAT